VYDCIGSMNGEGGSSLTLACDEAGFFNGPANGYFNAANTLRQPMHYFILSSIPARLLETKVTSSTNLLCLGGEDSVVDRVFVCWSSQEKAHKHIRAHKPAASPSFWTPKIQ
jgi:hypothetical protein